MIYIIEKMFVDDFENQSANALYSKVVGYVETEREAKQLCMASKLLTGKDSWVLKAQGKQMRELSYRPIDKFQIK